MYACLFPGKPVSSESACFFILLISLICIWVLTKLFLNYSWSFSIRNLSLHFKLLHGNTVKSDFSRTYWTDFIINLSYTILLVKEIYHVNFTENVLVKECMQETFWIAKQSNEVNPECTICLYFLTSGHKYISDMSWFLT